MNKINRYNTESFIKTVKHIHKNDMYDYSLVNYKNSRTKIKIICKLHGEFEQLPYRHIQNFGCKKCGIIKYSNAIKYSDKEFIEKSNIIHKNKYDYSLIKNYNNLSDKVKIICPVHGIFEQNAGNHSRGQGCKKCGIEKNTKNMSKEKSLNWNTDREQVKLNKKIHNSAKYILKDCLKSLGLKKNSKTEELLGYTRKQLLEHLQKDPNYIYWKEDSYNWHIDHIIPVKAFVENNITDLKIINALDNLRIISKEDNLKKNDKYIQEKFLSYIKDYNNVSTRSL